MVLRTDVITVQSLHGRGGIRSIAEQIFLVDVWPAKHNVASAEPCAVKSTSIFVLQWEAGSLNSCGEMEFYPGKLLRSASFVFLMSSTFGPLL